MIVGPFQLYSVLFNSYDSDARMYAHFNTFKVKHVPMKFAMSTPNLY